MRNVFLILGVVVVLAVGGVAIYQWRHGPHTPVPIATHVASSKPASTPMAADVAKAEAVAPDDTVLGRADAPVTVIAYVSLTCPHCRKFEEEVFPKVKSAYIDTGKVRWVVRDYPLDRVALRAAMVARCAGPDRRFALISLFFDRQEEWVGASDRIGALTQVAGLGGMSKSDVTACFDNKAVQETVVEQRLLAKKAFGVDETPTFIVNGTKHAGGVSFDGFKAILDPLIAKAGKQ